MAKQNQKYIDEWKSENVERLVIQPRKTEHIGERIRAAVAAGKASSRQAYILQAVNRALVEDGFPVPPATE